MRFAYIPTKRTTIFAVAAVVAAIVSYTVGYTGYSLAMLPQQLVDSANNARCLAGFGTLHASSSGVAPDVAASIYPSSTAPSLSAPALPANLTSANQISNPGLETLSGSGPADWSGVSAGKSAATFSQVLGHNSPRAVRIDVAAYVSGLSYWSSGTLSVSPGAQYQFSDYYRANVATASFVTFIDNAGQVHTASLSPASPSYSWRAYTVRFIVPTNVSRIQVFHALDRNGSLETDDYSLQQVPVSVQAPGLVSVVFNDGYTSVPKTALPVMQSYHVVGTVYAVAGFIGTAGFASASQLDSLKGAGWEIASMTADDKLLTGLSATQQKRELASSKASLASCYGPVSDVAYPFGTFSPTVESAAKQNYITGLSADTGINAPGSFDPFDLKVEIVTAQTSSAQIAGWLSAAGADHAWLILEYHAVDGAGVVYSRNPGAFESDMQQVDTSGLNIETVHQAYLRFSSPTY